MQVAKLIGPTDNVLTLKSTAAATLQMAVTAGKTLTLTATGDFNITFPNSMSFPADAASYLKNDGAGTLSWATPASGDIFGTGIVGRVAEFVTDTKHLQAAKLVGPTDNVLTLKATAAATSVTATMNKITRGADTVGLTATDVPVTQDLAAGGAAATQAKHKLKVTVTTPVWCLNTEYLLLVLTIVSNSAVIEMESAVANFTLRM